MSFVSHLECPRCHLGYEASKLAAVCGCGSPLLVQYDLEHVRRAVTKEAIAPRATTMWRYWELLPVSDASAVVTMGEGWTPVVRLENLGGSLDLPHLYLKDESVNPTGSLKARGASCGLSMARQFNIHDIVLASAGNAGGAWAAYAARGLLGCHVFMPQDAPEPNRQEVAAYGADLVLVRGLVNDCARAASEQARLRGWFDVSAMREPYRIEGKKTLGLEIAEQFEWDPPEVILCPTGGGAGLVGIWKAMRELRELGWLRGNHQPLLVAVQSAGCAPLVRAWESGAEEAQPWERPLTIAAGLRVPRPFGDRPVLAAIRESGGGAVAITDEQILDGMRLLARQEGLLVCPEGAATLAAAVLLRDRGVLTSSSRVLLLNTGAGIKYPDALQRASSRVAP